MNKEDALERKKYSYSTNNENTVKKVCSELGITQKELAEELGMKPTALSNWANGDIPQIAQKALELLLENKKLKENFKILKKAHKILSE
ncbi:MAG: XRE family transcriptional regulator [Aliarcobacter butzleri]|nr:MAG: XRE family transcriptional regulator [Aliarcobacter butzleri]